MCGLEPDDSSGNARKLSSSLITSALPRGNCHLFRIHATKPMVCQDSHQICAKSYSDLPLPHPLISDPSVSNMRYCRGWLRRLYGEGDGRRSSQKCGLLVRYYSILIHIL